MEPAPRNPDRPLACIVMAGGKGTRMRSATPKVLHPIWGRSLLGWVIAAVREAGADRIVVVVPPDDAEAVAAAADGATTVGQPDQLGTGDAVRCAMPALAGFDGDVPAVIAHGLSQRPPMCKRGEARRIGQADNIDAT